MAGPFQAGQKLTAAQLDAFAAPICVIKAVNQSLASSTVLQNDNALFLPVVANATYTFRAYLDYEGGTTGSSDLKFAWSVPAGASMRYAPWYVSTALVQEGGGVFVGATVAAGTNGAGTSLAAMMTGTLLTGGTAGNLQLQWAQNTSNAVATIMHAQSSVTLERIT